MKASPAFPKDLLSAVEGYAETSATVSWLKRPDDAQRPLSCQRAIVVTVSDNSRDWRSRPAADCSRRRTVARRQPAARSSADVAAIHARAIHGGGRNLPAIGAPANFVLANHGDPSRHRQRPALPRPERRRRPV